MARICTDEIFGKRHHCETFEISNFMFASYNLSLGGCPLWVKSRHFAVQSACLLPPKATLIAFFGMSALGQKQTYAAHKLMSALPPIATAKADMCGANTNVCFGPIADMQPIQSPRRRSAGDAAAPRVPTPWRS